MRREVEDIPTDIFIPFNAGAIGYRPVEPKSIRLGCIICQSIDLRTLQDVGCITVSAVSKHYRILAKVPSLAWGY